jgi:hypothetical protein
LSGGASAPPPVRDQGQAGACPDRMQAVPCNVRVVTDKEEVESRTTVANTVAKPLDDIGHAPTSLERRPRAPTRLDDPGRLAQNYGSEGWGSSPSERATAVLWTKAPAGSRATDAIALIPAAGYREG